jgi:hypothetical protein
MFWNAAFQSRFTRLCATSLAWSFGLVRLLYQYHPPNAPPTTSSRTKTIAIVLPALFEGAASSSRGRPYLPLAPAAGGMGPPVRGGPPAPGWPPCPPGPGMGRGAATAGVSMTSPVRETRTSPPPMPMGGVCGVYAGIPPSGCGAPGAPPSGCGGGIPVRGWGAPGAPPSGMGGGAARPGACGTPGGAKPGTPAGTAGAAGAAGSSLASGTSFGAPQMGQAASESPTPEPQRVH